MANCKDCVHNDMCYITHIDISVACSEFLDKNKYVEVVRCKDCKFAVVAIPPLVSEEKLVCTKFINWRAIETDHFCSCGERKDNG